MDPRSSPVQQFTAVIKQQGDCWYGWVEEIPGVNCQEHTKEQLVGTLRATLREAIELNRQDALQSAAGNYTEEPIGV